MHLRTKAALAALAVVGLGGAAPPPGGWCGAAGMTELSAERAKALGVPGGVILGGFNPGSPCNKAGLKVNDIVLQIAETPVTKPDEMRAILTARQPGDRVTFRYLDVDVDGGGAQRTLEVLLGVRPVEPAAAR